MRIEIFPGGGILWLFSLVVRAWLGHSEATRAENRVGGTGLSTCRARVEELYEDTVSASSLSRD